MPNNLSKTKKLIPISEAAEVLGISIDTVRRWDKAGVLHPERLNGKNRYFSLLELEKIKFNRPLPISEAANRLKVSASTLRRLEARGLIKPERNNNGERFYTHSSLENFLNSDYFLRQKEIESKVLKPLKEEPDSSDESCLATQHKILGVVAEDQGQKITRLQIVQKAFFLGGFTLATIFVLSVVLIAILFLLYPEESAKYFGYSSNDVLGVSYPEKPEDQGEVLGEVFKPISSISLQVVKQIDPAIYAKIVSQRLIEDVNDILILDQNGSIVPRYNFSFLDTSYLKIPDQNLVTNLNAEFLQGKVPGREEGNLVVFGAGGTIKDLKLSTSQLNGYLSGATILDGSISLAKLAAGVAGTPDDNSVTTSKIKDGEVKEADLADSAVTSSKISDGTITNSDLSSSAAIADSKLAQLTTANKVAGSAVQLRSGGGLSDNSGLTLLTSCSANQVLAWSGTAWACADSSGSVSGLTTANFVSANISQWTNDSGYIAASSVDTLTNKTLTAPKFADLGYIADSSGNEILIFDSNPSAVNQLTINNAATGTGLTVAAMGDDTDVGLTINSKAAGVLTLDSGTTGSINIGTSSNAKTITIGNATTSTGLIFTSGTGGISATSTSTTGTGLSFTDSVLTSGSLISFTSTNNSAADTTWSADLLTINNNQGSTAVSTGSIAGLDLQFNQNTSVAGNTETVARVAVKKNDSASTDQTVSSIMSLENNDTVTGNQISVTDGLKILAGTANNIVNAINLSGTFLTNLVTSSNFIVTNGGAVTAVGVNAGTGSIQGTGGLTVTGATASINVSSNFDTNINTGTSTGAVTIGGTAGNTINIGTDDTIADTIAIGSVKDSLAISSAKWGITSTGALTLSPTANSVTPLTVNATTGTAALAAVINQTQSADALDINLTHTSGTTDAGLAITVNGIGGATTDALKITQTAGTVTNGLAFAGTFTNLISAANFTVTNAGAVTAVGVNSGSGLIQGSGGLTISGGAVTLTSASSLIVPNSAGYAPTADASVGYDTTQDKYVAGGGTGGVTGSFPRVLSVINSTTDTLACSTISTSETAFASTYTIPANFFINNKVLRVTAVIEATTTAITHRLKMRVQSAGPINVDIWDTGAVTSVIGTNRTKAFVWTIGGTAAPGASVNVTTSGLFNTRDLNMFVNDVLNQPVAINTSAIETLQFTLTCGANTAGNSLSILQLIVEELN